MIYPFKIFPSVGYRNSQFQILSNEAGIKIDLFFNGVLCKEIDVMNPGAKLIQRLDQSGVYTASCNYNGTIFTQEIKVLDAFRLGSSEFKKAFVFDQSEYSFFLMKDRLLLYDEKNDILLTENHYSPTEIHQIDKSKYLFVTKIGDDTTGIVNFGIYDTSLYSIIGELLNGFQIVEISLRTNKLWLFNTLSNSIQCFELIGKNGAVFTELRRFKNASNYHFNSERGVIAIINEESVIFSDTKNVDRFVEISKTSKNAITKLGSNVIIDGSNISITNALDDYNIRIVYSDELNLIESDFIHIGSELMASNQFSDLTKYEKSFKDDIKDTIPLNSTSLYHPLPSDEEKIESIYHHRLFPTVGGLFILRKETNRKITGVSLRKIKGIWTASAKTTLSYLYSLIYCGDQDLKTVIEPVVSLRVVEYCNQCLVIESDAKIFILHGDKIKVFPSKCSLTFHIINEISYIIVKCGELSSVYTFSNFDKPLLDNVKILNEKYISRQAVVWFICNTDVSDKKKCLSMLDLSTKVRIRLDGKKAYHSKFKDATDYNFNLGYILSSNNIIIDPRNANIKDSILGEIESHSSDLCKVISLRSNHIYLSKFDELLGKYQEIEIKIDNSKYQESYLSPDGQFLVLQDESNRYLWYDIEMDKTVSFFSGNFLSFSKEGNLIVEEDGTRAVKIIDPLTFSDITPPNYHHFRFLSPDGKLYSQLTLKVRYLNKLDGKELDVSEVNKLRRQLDTRTSFFTLKQIEKENAKVDKNRWDFYQKYKSLLNDIKVYDHSKVNSQLVVKVEKFTEIGIVGTNVTTEIRFPDDLAYFNYAAFSYDNKYFAYVGKPTTQGLIHIFKINFVESENKLIVEDSYLSRYPRFASWVCGFSQNGYFATYDSTPDTYIVKIDQDLFNIKTKDSEIRNKIYDTKSHLYHIFRKFNEIKGKNFLSFSPTGEFIALSEQGYEPLTKGGYGHQESSALHIAITETGEITNSFTGHGDRVKINKTKKVTFVAFSKDEKRIMTMSSDGVVIVRDLNLYDE